MHGRFFAPAQLSGCGYLPWKIPPSGQALKISVKARTMTAFMKRPYAVPERTGWWASTAHGFLPPSIGEDAEHRPGGDAHAGASGGEGGGDCQVPEGEVPYSL